MQVTNKFVEKIKSILEKNFKDAYICEDENGQGLDKPCFFIKAVSSKQVKESNKRYKRSINIHIKYISQDKALNNQYLNIVDKLYELLDEVEIENIKYRPTLMCHDVLDKVLNFKLQFDFYLFNEDINKVPKFKKLEEVNIKSGRRSD